MQRIGISIGALARDSGCSVPTIRYYEEIGIMPVADRTASGQRSYDARAADRLKFIRRCRDYGFPIERIRQLLRVVAQQSRPCAEARELFEDAAKEIRTRIAELMELEKTLSDEVQACASECADGTVATCVICN